MSWICSKCSLTLVNRVKKCYCGSPRPLSELDIDEVDIIIGERRLSKLDEILFKTRQGGFMTPEEELHAELFNKEVIFVQNMSPLDLRAHIETLAEIAFKARARLGGAMHVERERQKAKKKLEGPSGFTRSINADATATEAINAVKKRGEKMSQMDKIKAKLSKIPGMDPSFVSGVMQARNIRDQVSKISLHAKPEQQAKTEEERKEFNPFGKKE
jgi:hypothetical protein